MKLQIVGAGVVGQATGKGFVRLGHDVYFWDINPDVVAALKRAGYQASSDTRDLLTCGGDVCFVCVPETKVENVVMVLLPRRWESTDKTHYRPASVVVIRSSVPPGTNAKLRAQTGLHISSNPEFLREAVAEYDFLNPPGIIIGACCQEHEGLLNRLYVPFRRPLYFTKPEVAELVKLAVNAYLACNISYWNQVKLLADKLGVNSHEVGMLASFGDGRVSTYGSRMHARAYGGKCLPKDLQQLIDACEKQDVTSILFSAVKEINDIVKE